MNVNKKIVLIAVGSVLLLLFLFAAVMLFRGIRQFGTAEQDLANARNQLDTFYKKKPFPTAQNIAIVAKNSELMEEWMRDMVDVAKRNQVDPAETRSPSVFINELAKIRNGLQQRAKLSKVKIDSEFGFGFDRYVKGEPATPDYVPRLIQQLLIVNEICGILIDEQVSEISSVRREQFEGARSSANSPGRRGRPAKRRTAQGSAPVSMRRASTIDPSAPNPAAGEFEDEDSIDTKIKFSFDFAAREDKLIQILNRLAQNEMFIVVTCVDIEAQEPVSEKPVPAKRAAVGRTNAALDPLGALLNVSPSGAATQEEEKAPLYKRVPSREERIVFGEKVEKPAQVHLELEVYRYK